jgi:uncharacterized protein (DUF342 family)
MQKLLIILLISNFIFLDIGNKLGEVNYQEIEFKLLGCWSGAELISEGDKGFLRFIKRKKIRKRYSGINYEFKENKVMFWQITSKMCGATKKEKPQTGIDEWEISKDSILEIKYKNEDEIYHIQKYKLAKIDESELLLEILDF